MRLLHVHEHYDGDQKQQHHRFFVNFDVKHAACFAELADQFCCINAAKIIAAHTAWFGPKSFAWPWVWAMGVGGCCSRGEKNTRVAVTLL